MREKIDMKLKDQQPQKVKDQFLLASWELISRGESMALAIN